MDFRSVRAGMVLAFIALWAGCSKSAPAPQHAGKAPAAVQAPVQQSVAPAVHVASQREVQGAVAQASHQESGGGIDTAWITDDYFAALVFHPRQILGKQPIAGESRAWLDAAAADLGVTLADVDQVCFLVGPPDPTGATAGEPAPIITTWIFRFTAPEGQKRMMERFLGEGQHQQTSHQGRVYYKDEQAPIALCAPDEKTVLMASERNVKKALTATNSRSLVLARLGAVTGRPDVVGVLDAAPLRPLLRRAGEGDKAGMEPSVWLRQFSETTHLFKEATVTADLAEGPLARLVFEAEDSQSAQRLEELAQGYHGTAALLLSAGKARWARGDEGQGYAPLFDLASQTLSSMKTTRNVRQVTVEAPAPAALVDLPQIVESTFLAAMRGAARQEQLRRLQMIGLAMHNHHVSQGTFPSGAVRDAGGRPLLSWRVHLLPWIGEEELYRQFRLDQPWDSPHNRPLVEKIPAIYQQPGAAPDGRTSIVALVGPGTPFSLSQGVSLRDFTDGPDNTILLVECGPDRAVPWTQPDDLAFDPQNPIAALGAIEKEGFLALYGDGRVEIIQPRIPPAELSALFTHAGGEQSSSPNN